MLRFKNFHLICDGCDDCIIRFKCYTHRGVCPITWEELKLVIEESKDEVSCSHLHCASSS